MWNNLKIFFLVCYFYSVLKLFIYTYIDISKYIHTYMYMDTHTNTHLPSSTFIAFRFRVIFRKVLPTSIYRGIHSYFLQYFYGFIILNLNFLYMGNLSLYMVWGINPILSFSLNYHDIIYFTNVSFYLFEMPSVINRIIPALPQRCTCSNPWN